MFLPRLSLFLPQDNPLLRLGKALNWQKLEEEFGALFSPRRGRPPAPVRLVVGLLILQHMEGLSDEQVVALWAQNHYWQAFCGYDILQGCTPVHATSLVRWRKKLKPEGMNRILQETLQAAQELGILKKMEFKNVIADTTVMPKAITHPTDTKLLNTGREKLVKLCHKLGIRLRQSFARKATKIVRETYRLSRARQFKKLQACVKKLRTMLGNVMRQIRNRMAGDPSWEKEFAELLALCDRLLEQRKDSKKKLYSLHAPETECISKGKLHKPYEFGCKVAAVVTHKQGFVVSCQAKHGAPYDGHTLKENLEDAQTNTGVTPKRSAVDKGYRKHGVEDTEVLISGQRGLSRWFKKFLRRRSAIEPHFGHMKADGNLDRNWLKGKAGDQMHALLCAVGHNVRLLLNALPNPKPNW